MTIISKKMNQEILVNDEVTTIPANKENIGSIKLNVRSYAGYSKIIFKNKDTNLFYWFFESQKFNPKFSRDNKEIGDTPLIIWLNGGPGAPSTLGLFLENGPYRMKDNTIGELIENEYSWNENAHIMYWDQPIGTGYSNIEENIYVDNEDELSEMFYDAFQVFLSKHPEYSKCPLYIMGESYAGKYVPNIASKIHSKNLTKTAENKIPLKGIAVGDGWINSRLQIKVYIDYIYTLGYVDTKQKDTLDNYFKKFCIALDENDWDNAYKISNDIVEIGSKFGGNFNVYDIRNFSDISMDNVQAYMELSEVKEALNVPINQAWNCSDNEGPVADHLIKDNMIDSSSVYSSIIKHEDLYKVLMYTGTFDTACGSLSTELILLNLNKWNNTEDNELWKNIDRKIWAQPSTKVKGFIKQFKNLTQIVLPNSGHQVPYYLPQISREMIYKWINDDSFPSYIPE